MRAKAHNMVAYKQILNSKQCRNQIPFMARMSMLAAQMKWYSASKNQSDGSLSTSRTISFFLVYDISSLSRSMISLLCRIVFIVIIHFLLLHAGKVMIKERVKHGDGHIANFSFFNFLKYKYIQ